MGDDVPLNGRCVQPAMQPMSLSLQSKISGAVHLGQLVLTLERAKSWASPRWRDKVNRPCSTRLRVSRAISRRTVTDQWTHGEDSFDRHGQESGLSFVPEERKEMVCSLGFRRATMFRSRMSGESAVLGLSGVKTKSIDQRRMHGRRFNCPVL